MKKRLMLCLLLLSMIPAAVRPDPPFAQDRFDRAGRLYEEGRYSEALKLYSGLSAEMSNWKVFYAMGNCNYKLGRFLEAKICYLKARKYRPLEPAIERNIQIVNREFKDALVADRPDFVSRMLARAETVLTVDALFLTILALALILNLFIFLFLRKGAKKAVLYGLSFSFFLCLFASGYFLYRISSERKAETAVIIGENSQLRSGPGEGNTVLFRVNPGLEVRVIEESRSWYQVSASSQIAGWVEGSRLKLI